MEIFFIVITITILASMTPWPDFILVMKNNISNWLKAWIYTSMWVGLWILVHAAYCIAGIWIIISQSILLFNIIKILWAIYLIYLWILLIKSKSNNNEVSIEWIKNDKKTNLIFIKEWFLWNALNPKATLFFLWVFTQVISPDTSIFIQILLSFSMMTVVSLWFITLSFLINISYIKGKIWYIQNIAEKIMWWILTLIWVKILFSSNK